MLSTSLIRSVRATLVLLVAGATLGASVAAAKPTRPRPRAVNLFAAAGYLVEVNRHQCGIDNIGEVCVAFAGSPVGGGGFWPKGTPDQYIFNSGLQLAGLVDPAAPFQWAGDTIGAYFFDARGDQAAGDGLSLVYSRLVPADVAAWSQAGFTKKVLDPDIYNSLLLGRDEISQGDVWVRYWEGDPTFLTGRTHPMGIAVDQRMLGWNFPAGNEDILYIVYTFYNVTARKASNKYQNTTIPVELQNEIGDIGDRFQNINEAKFKLDIPDDGYTITSMFAAQAMDADVAVFDENYTTAVLPFNIGTIYTGTFNPEVGWQFPPDIFSPPFASAPGFVGIKYLRSPTDQSGNEVGLTLFSQTTNSATIFPDPRGVNQLYRYLSGNIGPTDNPCSFVPASVARAKRLCFLGQDQQDMRFFQASGPLTLPPGEARSIVVAYINAAPYNGTGTPLVTVGGDTKPGTAGIGLTRVAGDPIRLIDQIMGWVSSADTGGASGGGPDGFITQDEVVTVPGSLLSKALVAQAVFDKGFLLPFAPAAPTFYLIPGDNQVSVVWEKSASEASGDPYFGVASNVASGPLYDPNFRQFDVEGYRVYRGRTSSQLQLVAQFDYAGTSFVDFTGTIEYGDKDGDGFLECAPELGLNAELTFDANGDIDPTGGDCPVLFPTSPTGPFVNSEESSLAGNVIQIRQRPSSDRIERATSNPNGNFLTLRADTAVINTQCANVKCPPLEDTGVNFGYVDKNVRNSFTYFYAVTAFDVNSLYSGPSSLESPRVTKRVTPRKPAPNETQAELISGMFGDDGVALDPNAPFSISSTTGRFSGTPSPTNGLAATFAPLISQILPAVSLTATIDSLVPHSAADFSCGTAENALAACYEIFVTFDKGGTLFPFSALVLWPVWDGFGDPTSTDNPVGALKLAPDPTSVSRFGVPGTVGTITASLTATLRQYIDFSDMEGQAARRNRFGNGAGISPGGSRWFEGTNETVDHPTYSIRLGHLTGVDTIWAPIHHTDTDPILPGAQTYSLSGRMQCFTYMMGGLGRQADVRFTWGAGGTVTSVRDLTHHVDVQYKPVPQATYGFIGDANSDGVISWDDFSFLETASQASNTPNPAGLTCGHVDPGPGSRAQLAQQPTIMSVSTEGAPQVAPPSTGTGFGLYIDGERYIFQLTGGNPPPAGTEWTLRTYAGRVDASSGAGSTTPSGYRFRPAIRPPAIPGLRVTFNVASPTVLAAESGNVLDKVHTVPDPYYVANALELTANQKVLRFVNLPPQAIIRIYSVSGILVNVIVHDDPGLGGEETWNLRNRNNQFVASGVYFYHIETPQGHTKVGRFTIVNFAP